MKVAIVTDWMISPGGSDRMVKQLAEHFDDTTIFTTVYIPENYQKYFSSEVTIESTFLQKLSLNGYKHRHLNVLAPIAFENIDLRGYDLVISLTAGSAKGVITAPDQPHISIILTPPRSLYFKEDIKLLEQRGLLHKLFSPSVSKYLKKWDQTVIHRADIHLSISKFIKKRVEKVYGINSDVLYPGISEFWFKNSSDEKILEDSGVNELLKGDEYFLIVSRIYKYKGIDRAIEVMRSLENEKKKLIIVGSGPDEHHLRKNSPNNVVFLGYQPDELIRALYQRAEALLFCGVEDFGYVPIEAMASGCPVIAYNDGGVTETVVRGVCGEFFKDNIELQQLLTQFDHAKYDKVDIINRAKEFSEKKFLTELDQFIEKFK